MKVYDRIWIFAGRLLCECYTQLMRSRFAAWGAGSRIELSAKLISPHLVHVENNVRICEHVWLNAKDDRGDGKPTLKIGKGTYIGRFVQINAWRNVVIEDNVLIADRVYISDAEHNYDNVTIPILMQGDYFKGAISLKQGSWLGAGVVVLPGVTIGRNSLVAANSVVIQDVPDYVVVAGNPAKIIKVLETSE